MVCSDVLCILTINLSMGRIDVLSRAYTIDIVRIYIISRGNFLTLAKTRMNREKLSSFFKTEKSDPRKQPIY